MPAKAVVQSPSLVAVAPPSQASQLPLLFCSVCKIPCRPEIPGGSGLARESGGSVTLVGGSCTAIAGKPAPTFDGGVAQKSMPNKALLWERACPRKRWFSHSCWWQLHRHRRQASSHFCSAAYAKFPAVPRSLVGAGLLAKAVVQSPFLVGDAPPSQASQLPPLFCSVCKIPCRPEIPCGSGGATIRLARESGGSVTFFGGRCTAIAGKPAPTFDGGVAQNSMPNKAPLWERACPRKR